MVEIAEFPHIAVKYCVQGVPRIIINEEHSIEGLPPDIDFIKKILKAIGK